MRRLFYLILLSCLGQPAFAASCWSITSGNWTSASTWSCGHVPTCGDNVSISPSTTVTIDAQVDLSGCSTPMNIAIWGTMQFGNGNKLKLRCGSNVYVETGGRILDAGGGGNSNQLQICGTTYWNAAAGPVTSGTCFPSPCNSPLPVTFTNVAATYQNGSVLVEWTTATEVNNDYFTVERSRDGVTFESIGVKDGAGTSSVAHYYDYVDEAPYLGVSYYRIRQTDFNGAYSFSVIVAVNAEELLLFPNPTSGPFTISVMTQGEDAECAVYSAIGQLIIDHIITADPYSVKTVSQLQVPPGALKPGMYTVHVRVGGRSLVKQLVVF